MNAVNRLNDKKTTKDKVFTAYFTPKTTDKVNLKFICTNDEVKIYLCQVNEGPLVVFVLWKGKNESFSLNLVSLNESDFRFHLYMNPKCCKLMSDGNKHMHMNLWTCASKQAMFDANREKSHSNVCMCNLFPLIRIEFVLSSDGLTEVFTRGLIEPSIWLCVCMWI